MRLHVFLAIAAFAAWGGYVYVGSRPVAHRPGVLVPEEPVQEDKLTATLPDQAGFHLKAVARYTICGRVLGKKRYWDPPCAKLVPRDLALGWGRMSDSAVLDKFHLSMGNRFFFYEWAASPPIPSKEIICHASNNHIIPASPSVNHAVDALRVGEIVRLQGWLVDATGPEGRVWNTSRVRDDTGNGACELFYVEAMETVEPEPAAVAALGAR